MVYKIEYAAGIAKDLRSLPRELRERALEIVEGILAKDPRAGRPLKGPYRGLWKFRIGDYRIIYTIEKSRLVVFVLRIRHRKEVYRGIAF